MNRKQRIAALEELYARIPEMVGCTKRCQVSCGPIDMSHLERSRIRAQGVEITPQDEAMESPELFVCDALTADGLCSVYPIRPAICRLWGTTQGMACPFGCYPEGGWLTDREVLDIILESLRIGGHPVAENIRSDAEAQAALDNPNLMELLQIGYAAGQAGVARRIAVQQHQDIPAAFRRKP